MRKCLSAGSAHRVGVQIRLARDPHVTSATSQSCGLSSTSAWTRASACMSPAFHGLIIAAKFVRAVNRSPATTRKSSCKSCAPKKAASALPFALACCTNSTATWQGRNAARTLASPYPTTTTMRSIPSAAQILNDTSHQRHIADGEGGLLAYDRIRPKAATLPCRQDNCATDVTDRHRRFAPILLQCERRLHAQVQLQRSVRLDPDFSQSAHKAEAGNDLLAQGGCPTHCVLNAKSAATKTHPRCRLAYGAIDLIPNAIVARQQDTPLHSHNG